MHHGPGGVSVGSLGRTIHRRRNLHCQPSRNDYVVTTPFTRSFSVRIPHPANTPSPSRRMHCTYSTPSPEENTYFRRKDRLFIFRPNRLGRFGLMPWRGRPAVGTKSSPVLIQPCRTYCAIHFWCSFCSPYNKNWTTLPTLNPLSTTLPRSCLPCRICLAMIWLLIEILRSFVTERRYASVV